MRRHTHAFVSAVRAQADPPPVVGCGMGAALERAAPYHASVEPVAGFSSPYTRKRGPGKRPAAARFLPQIRSGNADDPNRPVVPRRSGRGVRTQSDIVKASSSNVDVTHHAARQAFVTSRLLADHPSQSWEVLGDGAVPSIRSGSDSRPALDP